ncbi:MAG: RDD family protein, partial [Acidimicrobiales bacterium]
MAPHARVPPDPQDFRRQHGIETPEHVAVYLELAGVGSRGAAVFVDLTVIVMAMLLLATLLGVWGKAWGAVGAGGTWVLALTILVVSFLVLGYFTLFEALNGGRTPGKQALGIRVVMDTGRPLTASAAVVRNLTRLADCFFPLAPVLPALAMIALHPSNKRLGDIAAGTVVVRDRPTDWGLGAPVPEAEEPLEAGPPELSDAEFQLLDRLLARLDTFDEGVQARMTQELARRLEARV